MLVELIKFKLGKVISKIGLKLAICSMLCIFLFPSMIWARLCFLPDCHLDDEKFKFEAFGEQECLAEGYYLISSIDCADDETIETCAYNDAYGKCSKELWCQEQGYTVKEEECEKPEYVTSQCPNGVELFYDCEEDLERACKELSSDYMLTCAPGYSRDETAECPYSSYYTKCCNLCSGYDYFESDIGDGYEKGESCFACGNVIKYKKVVASCVGYQACSNGAQDGASTCKHGSEIWYSACCDGSYKYTCSGGGYVSGSGTSCGGKYASCICSDQYKWNNGACEYCGASYKYSCDSGSNVTGGNGTVCGNRYSSCTCSSGYAWDSVSGTCKSSCSDNSCSVGNILYSDMTCCKDVLSNKTAIGIVVKDNELVMSQPVSMTWASNTSTDVSGLTNITSTSTAQADMNGKSNTSLIVSAYTSDTTSNNAAKYCNSYTGGVSGTTGHWYLPAAGELYAYLYGNYNVLQPKASTLNWSYLDGWFFWSSSELVSSNAWAVTSSSGSVTNLAKSTYTSVSCFLPISVGDDGIVEPCSSEYKYACTGTGESGSGTACGGYYKQCSCSSGEWDSVSGSCKSALNCPVGYIFYSDMTCSANYDSSKTVAGIVVKDNEIIMSQPVYMTWSSSYTDVSGLTNIGIGSTPQADMNGKSNTSLIVSAFPSDTTSNNAAKYCNSYTGGISGTSGDWYLPAVGELYTYLYGNYNVLQPKASTLSWSYFESYDFWSSSEINSLSAWFVLSNDGTMNYTNKVNYSSVSCFLDISDIGGGSGDEEESCDDDTCDLFVSKGYCIEECGTPSYCTNYVTFEEASNQCKDALLWYGCGATNVDVVTSCLSSHTNTNATVECKFSCSSVSMPSIECSNTCSTGSTVPSCSGSNMIEVGTTECGNPCYTCSGGGECSDSSCSVGNIYYADGTCCADVLTNKTAAGIVIKDNELVMSEIVYAGWSLNYQNTALSDMSESYEIGQDMDGYSNTDIIAVAHSSDSGLTNKGNAAKYCKGYYPSGMSSTSGEWYLPAGGEMQYIYFNRERIAQTITNLGYIEPLESFWVSNEASQREAWYINPFLETPIVDIMDKATFILTTCFFDLRGSGGSSSGGETCDSSYKYTCSGTGESGSGTACGGYYKQCSCSSGEWDSVSGSCKSALNCPVGYIFYSDMTCSANYDSSKTVAGLVVKDNEVIMSQPVSMTWASSYTDVSGLTNITSNSTARTDMNGKSNTSIIASEHSSSGLTSSNSAAIYCNSYTGGISGTSGDWYLPAAGELYTYLYGNYNVLQPKASTLSWSYFKNYYFWSSSESGNGNAWGVSSNNGGMTNGDKKGSYSVSCFLNISDIGGGSGDDTGDSECSDSSCSVGHIMYADRTCCKDVLSGKTAIGVVVKENELVMSRRSDSALIWAYQNNNYDVSGIPNTTTETAVKNDYNGKSNTLAIVSELTPLGEQDGGCAAMTCNSYVAGGPAGSWYLPAIGELNSYVIEQIDTLTPTLDALGWPNLEGIFAGSSEYSARYQWLIDFEGYVDHEVEKEVGGHVICFYPFSVSDGKVTCSNMYKYTCSGTGYSGGSGTACGGKYTECTCSSGYEWDGSACVSTCNSSSANWCAVHSSCHGDCCSDGTYQPCETVCGGSGCCADSYQYLCSGTGYSGGSGTACGGYYQECTCSGGYSWSGSACERSCAIGDIMYSDGTCSATYNSSKSVVGVVVKDQELVMAKPKLGAWGGYGTDVVAIHNLDNNTKAKGDYAGRGETAQIVSTHSSESSSSSAAKYCNTYSVTGASAGNWYLPSAGEMYDYIRANYSTLSSTFTSLGWSYLSNSAFWTSSENSNVNAWDIRPSSGAVTSSAKNSSTRAIGCMIPIELNSSGVAEVCGSEYINTCTGEGYSSGSGSTCGGHYESCTCDEDAGYIWNGAVCMCDVSCKVGNLFYTDGTCSSCIHDDKTLVGIVVKEDEIVMSHVLIASRPWGGYGIDVIGVTNYDRSTQILNETTTGKYNTTQIVSAHDGILASGSAAVYCRQYIPSGSATGNKWYLPTVKEVEEYFCPNRDLLEDIINKRFGHASYYKPFGGALWTSSEANENSAWYVLHSSGNSCSGNFYSKQDGAYGAICFFDMADL